MKNEGIKAKPKKESLEFSKIVWKYLTQNICEEVFEATRNKERQRKWTLWTLVRMWLGLLQSQISSQSEAIRLGGAGHPLFPLVEATPESFFQRIQKFRPIFFRNIFKRFTEGLTSELKNNFNQGVGLSEVHFPNVYVIDASRLHKVGRVLKVARKITKAILPGSIEAAYNLRKGILHDLWFDPDGARSEKAMLQEMIDSFKPGDLLLADRYYCRPVTWRQIEAAGLWMVSRHNASVTRKKKLEVLQTIRLDDLAIDDWIVEMGGSDGEGSIKLRWVQIRRNRKKITLITNVLDPRKLSVEELEKLYAARWQVERLYLELKEYLGLNQLFNASPSAVGQQVYATAILYQALKFSHSRIAQDCQIAPEMISAKKLFRNVLRIFIQTTQLEAWALYRHEELSGSEEGLDLDQLRLHEIPWNNISLDWVLVEKRNPHRRKRRYTKARNTWTTYKNIPGAKKLMQY